MNRMSDAGSTPTRSRQAGYDQTILWSVAALMSIGVVAVYSALSFLAETRLNGDTELLLARHLMHLAIALVALVVFSRIDYRRVARGARVALAISLILLIAVQIYGIIWGGARRWIEIVGISFQPSELAKVALVVTIALLLAKKQAYIGSLKRTVLPITFWVLPTVLLIGVSDLSSAAMLLGTILVMCLVARVRMLHLASAVATMVLVASLFVLSSPERSARIRAHVGSLLGRQVSTIESPDRQGEGYQAYQARIAVAAGGFFGVGPGKSVQRDFLPAPYNDFIFSIIAEEYGAVGALALLGLFTVLFLRGFLRVARGAPDELGVFLAVGATVMIALYAFVHAGVSTGVLPVTGLPLPLVSYGGSSLITTGVLAGILLNISRHATR